MLIQLKLAWRYLWGHKTRTILNTLAIVFGFMLICEMNSMLPAFFNAFRHNMLAAASQVDLSVSSKTGGAFSVDVWDKVRNVQGIAKSTGSLRNNVNLPPGELSINAVTVAGIDPDTAPQVHNFS